MYDDIRHIKGKEMRKDAYVNEFVFEAGHDWDGRLAKFVNVNEIILRQGVEQS